MTVVYVSVKVYHALVEEVTAFIDPNEVHQDLREWKRKHEETEGSAVWTCPVEELK